MLPTSTSPVYAVFQPNSLMSYVRRKPSGDDPYTVWIRISRLVPSARVRYVLQGSWDPSGAATEAVTMPSYVPPTALLERMFNRFLDGKAELLPPVPLAIFSATRQQAWAADPAAFLHALMRILPTPGADFKKQGDHWYEAIPQGTRGVEWVRAKLPSVWIVTIPNHGIMAYDEQSVPEEVKWSEAQQPAPWNTATEVETYEEAVVAVRARVSPFTRKVYGPSIGGRRQQLPSLLRHFHLSLFRRV